MQSWIDHYRCNGWVKISGALPSTLVSELASEAEKVSKIYSDLDERNLRLAIGTIGGSRTLEQVSRISDVSKAFCRLRADPGLLAPLYLIYDKSPPIIFKDKLIYKPPGAKGALLHQDYAYWQGFPRSLLTVAIPIDRCTRTNECTYFFSPWRDVLFPTDDNLCVKNGHLKMEEATPCEMELGDICIFDCMTPHFSNRNNSDASRRCLFFSYARAADGDHYAAHHSHFVNYTIKHFRPKELREKYYFK